MSTATAHPESADTHRHESHTHPSDWLYVKVALLLGLFTAIEVSTYFIFSDAYTPINIALLLGLMVTKFGIVIMYFMHLKYDSKLFRRIFLGGLSLAVMVYMIAFSSLAYFSHTYEH